MKRDLELYITDMIESIGKIEEYTRTLTKEKFLSDTQVQDAVMRRLEIIGEAVKNVPEEIRQKYSTVPWRSLAGLRDVLIHGYFGVNLERIWKFVEVDVVELSTKIQIIRQDLKNQEEGSNPP
jgi:uncharacterized protein with HEPN domain